MTEGQFNQGPADSKCLVSASIREKMSLQQEANGSVIQGKSCRKYPDKDASPVVHSAALTDGNADGTETE